MSTAPTVEVSDLKKCTVISCPNYCHRDLPPSKDDIQYFDFPADLETARIWKEKCGVSAYHDVNLAKVCSTHFRVNDFTHNLNLKPGAVPRDNLGWMIGMPELVICKAPKFELVKEAVDAHEKLTERLEKLIKEQKSFKEKLGLYKRKDYNMDREIGRLQGAISKYPVKKNGRVENNLICKVFSRAQIDMLMDKKKVVWSYDDMAKAFTLRHIGNRECYLYLKDTLNMPLPSLSSVQKWAASNKM